MKWSGDPFDLREFGYVNLYGRCFVNDQEVKPGDYIIKIKDTIIISKEPIHKWLLCFTDQWVTYFFEFTEDVSRFNDVWIGSYENKALESELEQFLFVNDKFKYTPIKQPKGLYEVIQCGTTSC